MPSPPSGHPATALVVDDDPAVLALLRTTLGTDSFRVLEARDGTTALRLAADYNPDLVLLDLGLPDLDGVEVCRRLREWFAGPIVVLSARDQEIQKVQALDAGADDYMTKPVALDELRARIRSTMRRAATPGNAPPTERFESGPLRMHFGERRVWLDGDEIHLTPIEFKLLSALVRHAGRIVTHRRLHEAVWGAKAPYDKRYLRVYMTYLRRKLDPDPTNPRLLRTEPGVGYGLL